MEMTKENTYQNWKEYAVDELEGFGFTFKEMHDHFKHLKENKEKHTQEVKKDLIKELYKMAENYEIYYNWDWISEVKTYLNPKYYKDITLKDGELDEIIDYCYDILNYALGEEFNKREVLQSYLTENTEAHIEALRDFDETLMEEGYDDINEMLYGKTPDEIFWLGHFSHDLDGDYYYFDGYGNIECSDDPVRFSDENVIDEEAEYVLENLDNYYFNDDFKEYFFSEIGMGRNEKFSWIDDIIKDLLF